jgi:hypothetical protein
MVFATTLIHDQTIGRLFRQNVFNAIIATPEKLVPQEDSNF